MKFLCSFVALASLSVLFVGPARPQNGGLMPVPRIQFLNASGQPLAGGFLYTCVAGSACTVSRAGRAPSNPQATYSDVGLTTPNANPIVLDSAGSATVYLSGSAYKMVLQNAAGVTQWTQDNVAIVNPATLPSTAISGAVTGTLANTTLRDFVSVLDYGAKCDGSTDDSAAIQAALTASNGAVVRLPVGTCKANITLATGQSIQGAGRATSNAGDSGTNATVLTDASGGATPVITFSNGGSYQTVKDLTVRGNGSGSGDRGVYIPNAFWTDIENLACDTFGQECIRWEGGWSLRLVHVFADNTLLSRSRTQHTGAIYFGGTDGYISDTEVGASLQREGHSVSSSCYNDGLDIEGANHFIVNTIGETSELGWYINTSDSRFVNIRGDLNYCSGAWVPGGSNSISGSHFIRNGKDGNAAWDAVEVAGVNNTFNGVILDQTSGNTVTYGITDLTVGDFNYNRYLATSLLGSTAPLYHLAGSAGAAFLVPDKACATIADGTSSPILGQYNFYCFNQTTPLTITTLAGGLSGQKVCFSGNSNVTFATGGNIVPWYAPEAMVNSSAYCYINSGGTWQETAGGPRGRFQSLTSATTVTTNNHYEVLLASPVLTAIPHTSGGSMSDGTYYYKVAATDPSTDGAYSNEASATISGGGGAGSVSLSWTAVPGVVYYLASRGTSPGGETNTAQVFNGGLSLTDTGSTFTGSATLTGDLARSVFIGQNSVPNWLLYPLLVPYLGGTSTHPTYTAGSSAVVGSGSSFVLSNTSSDSFGDFSITAGTSPGTGTIATLTWLTPYQTSPHCTVAQNGGSNLGVGWTPNAGSSSLTALTVTVASAMVASNTYNFSYVCGQ